ncbi:MAG: hypothetical protein WBM43_02775 [Flavobacteriaceae bacterium]
MRWTLIFSFLCISLSAQKQDSLLISLQAKLDSLDSFEATVHLNVDIEHVNMPAKTARIRFEKGKKLEIDSESFIMVPKKGLDFNLEELFRYPYIALRTGQLKIQGHDCEVFRVIPESPKADFSIATLMVDPKAIRLVRSEISTRKNGEFTVEYSYDSPTNALPSEVVVILSVSDIRIPLRFLAKNADIDQKSLQADERQGKISILFEDYVVQWGSR